MKKLFFSIVSGFLCMSFATFAIEAQGAVSNEGVCLAANCPTPTPSPTPVPGIQFYRANATQHTTEPAVIGTDADCGEGGIAVGGGVDCFNAPDTFPTAVSVVQSCPSQGPGASPICDFSSNTTRYWHGTCIAPYGNLTVAVYAICVKTSK